MASVSTSEGTIPYPVGDDTFHTYYKVVGTLEGRTKRPLVVLHGGPGFSHDYMINVGDVATHGRPVIFYDQVGSGRSGYMPNQPKGFWTIDLFINQLFNLLTHFKIEDDFDLLGHSWGTIPLFEVIFRRQPAGLKHAILSNPICHMPYYGEARKKQVSTLPESVQEVLKKGYHDTPETRAALAAYAKLYQIRLEAIPPEFITAIDYAYKSLYVMIDMSEYGVYSCLDRLDQIKVPCLLVNGKYDACQDWTVAPIFQHLQRVKWVKFDSEGSSHSPFWEDRERYAKIVSDFLED